jgi:hypothetical protein
MNPFSDMQLSAELDFENEEDYSLLQWMLNDPEEQNREEIYF